MIINNFEQISNLLTFNSEDDFYHLQILKRKKDLPEHEKGGNNNARCIKTYYIKNSKYLLDKAPEIIALCELFTARAYINLNRKSFKKAAILTISELTTRIIQHHEDFAYTAYDSVIGEKQVNVGDKMWITDIDTKEIGIIMKYEALINQCKPHSEFPKVYCEIPTVNGVHVITSPFDVDEFTKKVKEKNLDVVDIQKNNPTVLYFNKKE